MPHFWDHLGKGPVTGQRNLQDGLFQIASQTCSLLVQVNNTSGVSFGGTATNIHLNTVTTSHTGLCHGTGGREKTNGRNTDTDQLLVLIPPHPDKHHKLRPNWLTRHRLSTVLEGSAHHHEGEDGDLWNHGYTFPADHDGSPTQRWGHKNKWCRPSCIPITLLCILIFLVVLLPLLDHTTEKALQDLNRIPPSQCDPSCRLSLVESIPEGLNYTNSSINHPSTFDTWLDLINSAHKTIDIASFYWTLRQSEVYPDPSSIKGEVIFQAILKAGTDKGINIRIAQNVPTQNYPNIDTEYLVKRKAATVRSLNFAKLLGGGVLHTKMWIIDQKHMYIGSANMDWRALTQVKELGISFYNCSCLALDAAKIFEVYWKLGDTGAVVPDHWPAALQTNFNISNPMNLTYQNATYQTYISSAPPPFSPLGRTNDIDALVHVIQHAEKFIYIAVMDYFPLTIYTPKKKFWPIIEDALRTAAIDNYVKVKLLISWWNHSAPAEDNFLKSLSSINKAYRQVSVEVRRFIVPANSQQQKIPFARVNHNKYMVTDNTAFIGTSNWSGDYFIDTAGVSFIMHDPSYHSNRNDTSIRSQLQSIFERDWDSEYAHTTEFIS